MANKDEVTFIHADELPSEQEQGALELVTHVREPWEETLNDLAQSRARTVRIPRDPDLKRRQVVNAFQDAFALIGGTPRLALWADENPGAFYALYSKLMPKQVEQETKHEGGMVIKHVLPRGKLDE